MKFEELLGIMDDKREAKRLRVQMTKLSRATGLSLDELMERALNLEEKKSQAHHQADDGDKKEIDFIKEQKVKKSSQ